MIRTLQFAVLIILILSLSGCSQHEDNNWWDQFKINDLAPKDQDGNISENLLQTINFDILVYEMPVDDFSKLGEIRSMLDTMPLRYNNRTAFSDNAFSAYHGTNKKRTPVIESLIAAGAQRSSRTTMMIPDGQIQDISVAILNQTQAVYFVSSQGLEQVVQIGPGKLDMRIQTGDLPPLSEYCNITVYPIFKLPVTNTIPQLNQRIQSQDYPFASAAFGLDMSPGDFVMLAPERYINDQSTLTGLFFNVPQGSLFLNPNSRQSPQLKSAFRIYLFTCVSITSE